MARQAGKLQQSVGRDAGVMEEHTLFFRKIKGQIRGIGRGAALLLSASGCEKSGRGMGQPGGGWTTTPPPGGAVWLTLTQGLHPWR